MLKLCNFSNYQSDLERINHSPEELEEFLRLHRLDGVEVLLCQPWQPEAIPARLVKGLHLQNYSIWLDFWRSNSSALLKQFGSQERIRKYYGGENKETLVENYRQQVLEAERIGAEYVVFHISHTEPRHLFDGQFTCSDEEVVEASMELLNEVFSNLAGKATLLLENLWMRGLTFLKPQLAEKLLAGINYPQKGFMLDTGHLLNTNPYLTNQQEGIEYIRKVLQKLGDLQKYIRGIHLQNSLSGEYVLNNRGREVKLEEMMEHIFQIDQHCPFEHPDIQKVVEMLEPQYLVYEFITKNKEEWAQFITAQNQALNL